MQPDTRRGRALSITHAQTELRINEIFFSLQGESTRVGLPTIFIRLTGCPLRCQYCDTAHAFHDGNKMSIDSIVQSISRFLTKYVTVTGGEPLAQKTCHDLLSRLCDEGYDVSLETSGALDISTVDERVMKIMDIKTPSSIEQARNRLKNLYFLNPLDQVKFVIGNRDDYDWSCQLCIEHQLTEICEVLFSPEHESQDATELAEWILEDNLSVRMQLQLHKYLWGNVPGH